MAGFTYKSYNFIDKDPIIDEVRTVYEQSGATYKWIHEHSNVSPNTLNNWFSGTTKRPQAASINAVLRCLGYKLGIVEEKRVVVVLPAKPPLPSTRHVIQMNKYKAKGGKRK